jgi:hypothetical protein
VPRSRSFLSLPFGRTRFGAGKFFARAANYRSTVALLAPRPSLQTRWRASPRAISPPLASRYRRRGTLPAQFPIAELAARPTEAYFPRFRALALFGRRPAERGVRSSLPAAENLHNSGCEQIAAAQPYSITSSAVASSLSGIARSSISAVCRLMTSSNFDDCTTGRSAGFAPLRMRPV